MNMDINQIETPIVFTNPITGKLEMMPTEMVSAYVPYATDLDLEKAAQSAWVRDDEAANNLLLSVIECTLPTVEMLISQGVERDELSVEAPSLR